MTPSLLIIPIVIAIFLIIVLVLQLLWNSTFPDLFGWKRISFWTAFKILLIAMILFGGGLKYPVGYGTSSTKQTDNGTVTTSWSFGSSQK